MTVLRIFTIALITLCTAVAWGILGTTLQVRTQESGSDMGNEVAAVWGASQKQLHPSAFYHAPTGNNRKVTLQPDSSKITVNLSSEPKKRGLLWHRTYSVQFNAEYQFTNPTPIPQTIYVQYQLPSEEASYTNFVFTLGDESLRRAVPKAGVITEALTVPAKGTAPLKVSYESRGMETWRYAFPDASRVQGFELVMQTDFAEINFPNGTGSPTSRDEIKHVYTWSYPDVLSAPAIGMDMPKVLNAGPVASRIAFFAPVSLVFFFTVLVLMGVVLGINLHPMNYFFLAAGCFAFQLLFAYLVDLVPLHLSFVISAVVSLLLVGGYIMAVGGKKMLMVAVPAQFAYMVLFSYSFFFDGMTGITITIGAIFTLALLMKFTAKVNWAEQLAEKKRSASNPPVMPPPAPPSGGRPATA
ncbi:inner membrane CreD family protein [Roseimicrobium sp. ORNL1]|uniref:inner membrane CreD family protein n=1 Tax=Roseimicrobium sp. ORNL1 TaxID=2711231 RepID=UPI0013E10869|nr:inner membrane CreD family protein [Roseimicrobium sp. ORNL1]QIF05613.1 cell envelope integrity protein CreD [Roseimicrobium sp. ORNL1]